MLKPNPGDGHVIVRFKNIEQLKSKLEIEREYNVKTPYNEIWRINKTGTVQVGAALKAQKFNRGRGFMLKIKKNAIRKKNRKISQRRKNQKGGPFRFTKLFYYLETVK